MISSHSRDHRDYSCKHKQYHHPRRQREFIYQYTAAPDKYQQGSDYQKAYLTYDSVDFKRVVLFVHLSVNQLLKPPLTVYLEHIGGDFLCITAFRTGRSVGGRGFFRRVKLDCYIALGI